jgi:hypothetical protein
MQLTGQQARHGVELHKQEACQQGPQQAFDRWIQASNMVPCQGKAAVQAAASVRRHAPLFQSHARSLVRRWRVDGRKWDAGVAYFRL